MIAILIALVLALSSAAAVIGGAHVSLRLNGEVALHTMRGGLGASWHAIETPIPIQGTRSHGGCAWGGHPPAEDNHAWRQIYRHADWLGLDFIRVELEQRMYEPERGRFTWDSSEMKILYRILDWCQRRQADVFLQQMWSNVDWNAFPEFRGDPIKRVHSGPASMEAFADGLAALVKHLVQTKGYTCIKWICINNEPGYNWSWWQRPPNEPIPLREGLAAARRALDREAISIPLSGPDWTDLPAFKAEAIDFDAFIGAYDLHSYNARFDWSNGPGYLISVAEQRLKDWRQWTFPKGKPLFLSELGTMVYGWGTNHLGPSTWEAAIKDAELVVRAMNVGVEGFNRWSFVNRGDLDGTWQMIDTWDPRSRKPLRTVTPRPNSYYVYGLISRFVAKHSNVMMTETIGGQIDATNRVFAAALKSPQRNMTWLIVNDAPHAWEARLDIHRSNRKSLYKYQVTSAHRDRPDLHIAPLRKIKLNDGAATFDDELPAMSLTIFSTYKLSHSNRGVTVE